MSLESCPAQSKLPNKLLAHPSLLDKLNVIYWNNSMFARFQVGGLFVQDSFILIRVEMLNFGNVPKNNLWTKSTFQLKPTIFVCFPIFQAWVIKILEAWIIPKNLVKILVLPFRTKSNFYHHHSTGPRFYRPFAHEWNCWLFKLKVTQTKISMKW